MFKWFAAILIGRAFASQTSCGNDSSSNKSCDADDNAFLQMDGNSPRSLLSKRTSTCGTVSPYIETSGTGTWKQTIPSLYTGYYTLNCKITNLGSECYTYTDTAYATYGQAKSGKQCKSQEYLTVAASLSDCQEICSAYAEDNNYDDGANFCLGWQNKGPNYDTSDGSTQAHKCTCGAAGNTNKKTGNDWKTSIGTYHTAGSGSKSGYRFSVNVISDGSTTNVTNDWVCPDTSFTVTGQFEGSFTVTLTAAEGSDNYGTKYKVKAKCCESSA